MRSERLRTSTEQFAVPSRYSFFRLLRPSQSARVLYVDAPALEQCSGYVRAFRGYSPVTLEADLVRTNMVIRACDPLAWRLKTSPGHGDTN